MRRLAILAALAITLSACMTAVTPAGAQIEIVTAARKEQCTSLGIVAATEAMGNSMTGDAMSAMNKVRNRAAAQGGNAMFIISSTSTIYATTVTAEALKCPPRTVNQ